jgi:copper(I)-binding protein
MYRLIRLSVIAAGCCLSLAASAHEFTHNGVTVSHPWLRATPGGVTIGAAYLKISADEGKADRLVGVSSPVAETGQIHTNTHEGDVVKMRQVEGVEIPAGKSVVLKPGGDHIMLMGLKTPLKEGDLVKLTLQFEKAGPVEVEASVEAIGAKGPHGFNGQPAGDDADHEHGAGAHDHHSHH